MREMKNTENLRKLERIANDFKINSTTKKSSSKKSPRKHVQNILNTLLKELASQKSCTDLEILKLPPVHLPTF